MLRRADIGLLSMFWISIVEVPVCLFSFFPFFFSFPLYLFRHEGTNLKDRLHDDER